MLNLPVTTMPESSAIALRPATLGDIALLRRWDEQPQVVAADPNDDWDWEVELARTPAWREQLIAELGGRPIGVVQIIDPAQEDSHYWGEVPANLRAIDIWIGEPTELGKGYGTTMMRLALARCFAAPLVTAVLIDPLDINTRAHRFYQRLGFTFLEHRRFGDDDCSVYRLDRATWAEFNAKATSYGTEMISEERLPQDGQCPPIPAHEQRLN